MESQVHQINVAHGGQRAVFHHAHSMLPWNHTRVVPAPPARFCKHCGQQKLVVGSNFCQSCGKSNAPAITQVTPQMGMVHTQQMVQPGMMPPGPPQQIPMQPMHGAPQQFGVPGQPA